MIRRLVLLVLVMIWTPLCAQITVGPSGLMVPGTKMVSANIENGVAEILVKQTIYNPSGREQEVRVFVPILGAGEVSNCMLMCAGKEVHGRLFRQQEGQAILRELITDSEERSLISYWGKPFFLSHSFSIGAEEIAKLNLRYTQQGEEVRDSVRFLVPRTASISPSQVAIEIPDMKDTLSLKYSNFLTGSASTESGIVLMGTVAPSSRPNQAEVLLAGGIKQELEKEQLSENQPAQIKRREPMTKNKGAEYTTLYYGARLLARVERVETYSNFTFDEGGGPVQVDRRKAIEVADKSDVELVKDEKSQDDVSEPGNQESIWVTPFSPMFFELASSMDPMVLEQLSLIDSPSFSFQGKTYKVVSD